MIDHTGVVVSDLEKSCSFYAGALAGIGFRLVAQFPAEVTGGTAVAGFGEPPKPEFWLGQGEPNSPRIHVAFRVPTRAQVDRFHRDALAAGGRDNGGPGLRPHYHENYYGAFVLDPDGHNIEVVCHEPPGVQFKDANLQSARFDDVNLRNSRFDNVALAGAQFSDVSFAGASIVASNLEGMKINGILVTELLQAHAAKCGSP